MLQLFKLDLKILNNFFNLNIELIPCDSAPQYFQDAFSSNLLLLFSFKFITLFFDCDEKGEVFFK